ELLKMYPSKAILLNTIDEFVTALSRLKLLESHEIGLVTYDLLGNCDPSGCQFFDVPTEDSHFSHPDRSASKILLWKRERRSAIRDLLSLPSEIPGMIRYQLLHVQRPP